MLESWAPQIPWLGAFGYPVILLRVQPCKQYKPTNNVISQPHLRICR